MKKLLIAALLAAAPAGALELQIDPAHSTAEFAIKHLMVTTVRGRFGKTTGTVNYDPKDPTKSTGLIRIDASTIDTQNEKRDAHLKSAEFFDVQRCPEITFKSTKVEKAGDKKFKVTGELTMHCVTKPTTVDVDGINGPIKSPFNTTVYAASVSGKVNRKDFGLLWNASLEGGGVVLGDEVTLTVDLEMFESGPAAKKQAAAEDKAATDATRK
jgi:polyisoprenoid-binding protein YceI